jgi:hypothetical protein
MSPDEEARFVELWNQGATYRVIAQAVGCALGMVGTHAAALVVQGKIQPRLKGGKREQSTAVHPSTPAPLTRYTEAHPGPPPAQPTEAHPGTPNAQPTAAHPGTPTLPARQSTPVHPSTPIPDDAAVRLLTLLPDLERIVARERDRQRLLSTPVGTPQHTVKKTYVIEALYVDLIEQYAQAEGVERKDVVNLAFHEFFERRQYLPPADHPS